MSELIGKLPEESYGYVKFPNGTLMQWGKAYFPGASQGGQGYVNVNFPAPFLDSEYSISATPIYAGSSVPTYDISAYPANQNTVTLYGRYEGTAVGGVSAFWQAIGRWK